MKKLDFVSAAVVISVLITACKSTDDKKSNVSLDSKSKTFGMVPTSLPENFDVDYGQMVATYDLPPGTYTLTRVIAHDIRNLDNKKVVSAVDHKLLIPGSFNTDNSSGDKVIGYTSGNIKGLEDGDMLALQPNIILNVPKIIEIKSDKIIPLSEVAWDAMISKDGKTAIEVKDVQAQVASVGELLGFQQNQEGIIKNPNYKNISMTVHTNENSLIFYIQHVGEDGQYVNYFLFYSRSEEA